MTRLSLRPNREQQALLAACTTSRRATPAAHLGRRADRDRPVGFADVAAMPDPAWATAEQPGRFTVAGLVPVDQLAVVPLAMPMRDPSADPQPLEALLDRAEHVMRSRDAAFEAVIAEDREATDDRGAALAAGAWIDDAAGLALTEDCAAVLDAVAARPELRHYHALLMALAPVAAMLKGPVA